MNGIPDRRIFSAVFFAALISLPGLAHGDQVRVAVAANFVDCLEALAPAFEEATGHQLLLIRGSTGRHFAQIKSGAPFDVFLAADSERPTKLESMGLVVPGSRFTYAEGRLALWIPDAGPEDKRPVAEILEAAEFNYLAIANPRLAPYGLAAKQALENMDLWEDLRPRLVTGQSVGQAWQFVASGNAEAGFVAYPQILAAPALRGRWWKIDPPLHEPILQQAVVLKNAKSPAAGARLLEFLQGSVARLVLIKYGYLIPEN
ncbi:MAG: molybdate ABC transporter substrate-binding protein [Candidatus Krumholzibacteriota bacterium]